MATMTEAPAATLTYEAYMAESEVQGRYDIVNGVRIFMPGATWDHQTIAMNLVELLRQYARASGVGKVNTAPFDVLIRRVPRLQTRQPDVLFVSFARLAQVGGRPAKGPLGGRTGVSCRDHLGTAKRSGFWRTRSWTTSASAWTSAGWCGPTTGRWRCCALMPGGARSVATYGDGQVVTSEVFAGLGVSVVDVFAP